MRSALPLARRPRGWIALAALGLATTATIVTGCSALPESGPPEYRAARSIAEALGRAAGAPAAVADPGPTASPTPSAVPDAPTTYQGPPSDEARMRLVRTISGGLAPKSVVASGTGLFIAQNMMYGHTMVVFDRRGRRVATIPDRIRVSRLAWPDRKGWPARTLVRGAPVEAVFTADGSVAYVSQYSMYGAGFDHPGWDYCTPRSRVDDSYVYRVDMERMRITDAIRVGPVPKALTLSPNGRWLLVSNWCSHDMSVVDLREGREVRRVPTGPFPRGIAVDPDSETAYVALMGDTRIVVVDLRTWRTHDIEDLGFGPRSVVISRNGRWLYASVDAADVVHKIDRRRERVVDSVRTGQEPRSMELAPDGRSLYVVNYSSDSMSKIRTRDMRVLQTVKTPHHPVGLTVDRVTGDVWVACYSGVIQVFRNR